MYKQFQLLKQNPLLVKIEPFWKNLLMVHQSIVENACNQYYVTLNW